MWVLLEYVCHDEVGLLLHSRDERDPLSQSDSLVPSVCFFPQQIKGYKVPHGPRTEVDQEKVLYHLNPQSFLEGVCGRTTELSLREGECKQHNGTMKTRCRS